MRIARAMDFELKPELGFIEAELRRSLQGRLAAEDSAAKKAVVIGRSLRLAELLGVTKARILHLPYPDFTIENLALLSDEYDFVIADRVLHRCRSTADAARETIRVLRPGGWFVHTASILDFTLSAPVKRSTLTSDGLRALFSGVANASASKGAWATAAWILGQKPEQAPVIAPSIVTRKAQRPGYRFRPQPAKFGVVTMMRNEAPYLLEWIAHYRVLGFRQITIYDNQSNDASAEILRPLSKAGIINACFWRDRHNKQNRAYNQALRRLRRHVEWCLFADLDEFLVLDPGLSLEDILPKEPDVAAVSLQWLMFGSAGLRNRDVGLTIERFTRTVPKRNRLVKSIVRLRDIRRAEVHIPRALTGRVTDVLGRTVTNLRSAGLPWIVDGPARIHHYIDRSWEEFECKRARGRGAVQGGFRPASAFDRDGPGEIETLDALRLAPAIKEEIARLRKIVGER